MSACDFCGRPVDDGFPLIAGEEGWRMSYEGIGSEAGSAPETPDSRSRYACRACAKERLDR